MSASQLPAGHSGELKGCHKIMQGNTDSSCARGDLDCMLTKFYSLKGLSGIGTGCPGSVWVPIPGGI